MFSLLRFSSSTRPASDSLGEVLLRLSFLRAGIHRSSVDELPDSLRRDVGLLPRERASVDPRDLRW